MRAPIVFAALIALGATAGCKKTKEDRCEAVYAQWMRVVEELNRFAGETGAGGAAAGKASADADEKRKFMVTCRRLPDDAVDCLSFEKMLDDRCAAILEQAEAEVEADEPPRVIEWETAKVADGRATARVPKGWTHEDFIGDRYTPPDDADLGVFTSYTIGSSCGGACEARTAVAWAAVVEEEVVAVLKDEVLGGEIVRDERLGDGGRLLVSRSKVGRKTIHTLTAAFWKEGAERYFTCEAELDPRLAKNLADFEQACRALVVE